jgi:hypothetical protein
LFGRSDLFLRLEVIKKIILVILTIIGFMFGIYGLVWSNVIISILALVINTFYSGRFLNYSAINQFLDLIPILFVLVLTFVLVLYFRKTVHFNNYFLDIFSTLLLIIIIIILVSEKIKLSPFVYLKDLFKEYFA